MLYLVTVKTHSHIKMASGFFVAVLTVIFLQIGTGKDIKWIRNSNWDNEENWDLGRLPCKGDIASFSKVVSGL